MCWQEEDRQRVLHRVTHTHTNTPTHSCKHTPRLFAHILKKHTHTHTHTASFSKQILPCSALYTPPGHARIKTSWCPWATVTLWCPPTPTPQNTNHTYPQGCIGP